MLVPARLAISAGALLAFSHKDRAAGKRCGGQFRAERCLPGGTPSSAVAALAEHAAAGAAEQPPVWRGAELAEMAAEHAG